MPGVADQVRRTQLSQDQQSRKRDMDELLRMVSEDRLHEADERQLEMLRMIKDLRQALEPASEDPTVVTVNVDNAELIEAVKQAMGEVVANMPAAGPLSPANDPSRPKMKHTSMADLAQGKDDVTISHAGQLGEELVGEEDSSDKLEKLKKLKGQ